MPNIKPLGDKVVVEVLESDEKTAGGIYLPDSAKKKPQLGTVVAVGEGKILENGQRSPMNVNVGDRVLFSRYGGNEVNLEGKEYTILEEDQIYAVVHTK